MLVILQHLRRSYYWPGLRSDVHSYCRSCLTCASRKGTGRKIHPPLKLITVGGSFHRIGVDIVKLPQTTGGNRYVASSHRRLSY